MAGGAALRARYGARQAAVWVTSAVGSALFLLYRFPPGEGLLYPACWFHAWTGLYCPGCGSARALHALLHGELGLAMDYNLFVVVAGPAIIAWGFLLLYGALRYDRMSPPAVSGRVLASALLLAVAFAVSRNLSFAPFSSLAP